ncbi:MAG: MFS transporter [Parachlamydiales bacterium]|nr:MFS transporter [Parachlamydiales bacterium]
MASRTLKPSFAIIATLLGNTLEWFEYLSFAFFIPTFAKVFFSHSPHALSNAMIAFSIAYIMRPIGGIFFGYIGDRYGRKRALIASILFMSFPTFLMGIMPTYAQIGFTSVILLFILRTLQGLGTGGEFPASMTFLTETAPPSMRSFYGSFAYFGLVIGVFLGGTDYFLLNRFFPDSSTAWRSTYLFGSFLGLCAFFLRTKLHETHPFQSLKEAHEVLKDPILTLFQKYKKPVLKLMGVQILQAVSFNVLISFSIIYFSDVLNLSSKDTGLLNWSILLALVVSLPFAGILGDKIGQIKLLKFSAWGYVVLSVPFYLMIQIPYLRIPSLIAFALLSSLYLAPSISAICQMFPAKVRLSGVSMGYNLTVAIFGGTSPLICYHLIQITGLAIAPAFYIMAAALISLVSLQFLHDHH